MEFKPFHFWDILNQNSSFGNCKNPTKLGNIVVVNFSMILVVIEVEFEEHLAYIFNGCFKCECGYIFSLKFHKKPNIYRGVMYEQGGNANEFFIVSVDFWLMMMGYTNT